MIARSHVRIGDVARLCRSKNAGPALVTIDVVFDEDGWYGRAKEVLTADTVARAYGIPGSEVARVCWDEMRAIKLTIPRTVVAGSPGDRDVYGCQEHVPVWEMVLSEDRSAP